MMKTYKIDQGGHRNWSRVLLFTGLFVVLIVVAAIIGVKSLYEQNLKPVDVDSTKEIPFVIDPDDSVSVIISNLKSKDLIRSEHAFNQYVRSNQLGEQFKFGTYSLKKSYNVQTIVDYLTTGKFDTSLCTILPGKTVDELKVHFQEKCGFTEVDVIAGFKASNFEGHPALVDKPAEASLEGYFYPDSYELVSGTKVATILTQSLDEMAEALSPEVREGINEQGLSIYEGIILASIVENEVTGLDSGGHPNDDRHKAAQVFIRRLNEAVSLESNATDNYPENYNTYNIVGLPPTPITNVSSNSLKAVASPANTNYLFFVTGCDKVNRFSTTIEKHDEYKTAHGVHNTADCR